MPILTLPNNPTLQGLARITPDVVYSTATGEALKATFLTPWNTAEKHRPAIVFVQGSAWTTPDVNFEIPQLSEYARAGYVVMTASHRSRLNGHPFPAFLQDVKCAVRYLRAHADDYGIDPERIGIFGTSSGGNAALLTAMTMDDARYKTAEYGEYSDSVACMVECFGPTWIERLPESLYHDVADYMAGDRPASEVCAEMSPCCIVKKEAVYPPMLLIQGDADLVVPYEQTAELYERLEAAEKDVKLIVVKDAPHEDSFWSAELHRLILSFLDAHLMY